MGYKYSLFSRHVLEGVRWSRRMLGERRLIWWGCMMQRWCFRGWTEFFGIWCHLCRWGWVRRSMQLVLFGSNGLRQRRSGSLGRHLSLLLFDAGSDVRENTEDSIADLIRKLGLVTTLYHLASLWVCRARSPWSGISCITKNRVARYLLNSSSTKMPPFCVKHLRMFSKRTKNCDSNDMMIN